MTVSSDRIPLVSTATGAYEVSVPATLVLSRFMSPLKPQKYTANSWTGLWSGRGRVRTH